MIEQWEMSITNLEINILFLHRNYDLETIYYLETYNILCSKVTELQLLASS